MQDQENNGEQTHIAVDALVFLIIVAIGLFPWLV